MSEHTPGDPEGSDARYVHPGGDRPHAHQEGDSLTVNQTRPDWTETADRTVHGAADQRTLELREEQLVPHKEWHDVGEVVVRTRVEEVPGRVEVEAFRDEVEIEHEAVGKYVTERVDPWEDGESLIIPVYEEQLVVSKRLLLREHLRVRRVRARETQVFEDTLRRERLVVEDPANTGLVHEQYPTGSPDRGPADTRQDQAQNPEDQPERQQGGVLQNLVRKVLE